MKPEHSCFALDTYQEGALRTSTYPRDGLWGVIYTTMGLAGEAGELSNGLKKVIRDDGGVLSDVKKAKLIDELGDVLWYAASLANELGVPLSEVARRNLEKLADREKRGVLGGSGDNR